ncbi:MAG: acyl-CoA desaturase [Gammaproteobacteria bacterium]|nr:acyl-CoA desaturase [Gammaproteobacteria bacterium]
MMIKDISSAQGVTREQDLIEMRPDRQIDWVRIIPFILLHMSCLAVFFVGVSWFAIIVMIGFYLLRMFAITAFYHRYFSHKAFKTGRLVQFIFALIGVMSTQNGPLWWAAHHRYHHRHADQPSDLHSPRDGFWYSHMGWFLNKQNFATQEYLVKDWIKFPELRWLDRHSVLISVMTAASFWIVGSALAHYAPSLKTNGIQLFVWGFLISTILLTHITLTINSFAHRFGFRTYETQDDSRNNWFLAILTLGEGWHNNHHYCPASVRQGFIWWQIDISYYILRMMAAVGLVWDLVPIPKKAFPNKFSEKIAPNITP